MKIQLATTADLPAFFTYLNDHLSDNGKGGTNLFQPLSRDESCLNDGMKGRFSDGISQTLSPTTAQTGWRRLWIALDGQNNIIGHIDIRAHPENHTQHRTLLGMGVDRNVRKQGLGTKLLSAMVDWVKKNTTIEYIDLCVLSENDPARQLYLRFGFEQYGEIKDMFRIEGKSSSYSLMSYKIVQ
ncbi:MAG: RimJ/RimL family protein N-acetyltransferase [Phenylobacterium sp.]